MSNKKIDDKPICKFGPGGDFVSAWPMESDLACSTKQSNVSKAEPMLFADIRRAEVPIKHKPKQRLKVSRKVVNKRPALSLVSQNTFFDLNCAETA